MKRILVGIILLGILGVFVGCAAGVSLSETEQPSHEVVYFSSTPPWANSIAELEEDSQYVVIGTVKSLNSVRISQEEMTGKKPDYESLTIMTRCQFEVSRCYKGDLKVGDEIEFDVLGGTVGNLTERYWEEDSDFQEGLSYLIFLSEPKYSQNFNYGKIYPYNVYQGVLEVYGNHMLAHRYGNLWKRPEGDFAKLSKAERAKSSYTVEEVKLMIMEAMKENANMNTTKEE